MQVESPRILRSWRSIILFNEQMKAEVFEFSRCDLRACDSMDQVDLQSIKIVAATVAHLLKTFDMQ
ncbi:hypothetical protein [Acinetobacter terrae]|uniref:hypothetical protein n=1 Tax=Acinetobacter terrae TaxID=2731247 RepID=UPI001BE42E7B|nr:hypothetical protein [Acinetobacter terrae]